MKTLNILICLLCVRGLLQAEDAATREKADAATELFKAGKQKEGIEAISKLIDAEPQDNSLYLIRAEMRSGLRDFNNAVLDYSVALKHQPEMVNLYQARGAANFRAGNIEASIKDFDKYLAAHPEREPYHWQRGISHYYAGKFKDGTAQFELHKTVNPNDVENSVFHFICNAPLVGVEKAREAIIKIRNDSRIPMMKVLDMYAGKATPEDVLKRAQEGNPPDHRLANQLFYAHLYIGLYYEALGKKDETAKHIKLAATKYFSPHYMGDVARVHWEILQRKAKQPE
jgi:lipoprotein NlpI